MAKVYERKKFFFLEFAKGNVCEKKLIKLKKNVNSFYLFQTTNLVKLVQILKRFSQELSSLSISVTSTPFCCFSLDDT